LSRTHFPPFEFDAGTGELWLDGRRVKLQRQPSRLLELLLSRPGGVIAREEIRLALWGADTHVDFERSLNFCVARLRSALRDDAASPRFVETVPTRGYRFIGVLSPPPLSPPAAVPAAPVAAAGPERAGESARPWWAGTSALMALLLIGLLAYRTAADAPPRIVVVPFHNETGTADLDRIAKGVSDAAVARLATPDRLSHFLVIGNAAGLEFSFKPANMKAMGESLGARFLLLGQLKKDGQGLRIVAHLIRVSDQTHVWARTYDTSTLDLAQQAAIAEAIAREVTATVPKA
jgi:TolB-like protein/DNA-binding winged helix-turn-helix (wHTH) protein